MGNCPTVDGHAPIHIFALSDSWIKGEAALQLELVPFTPGVVELAAMPDLHPSKLGPSECRITVAGILLHTSRKRTQGFYDQRERGQTVRRIARPDLRPKEVG